MDVIVGKILVKHRFLGLIDYSFEERRKILTGKQRKGRIINIKLL